MEFHQFFSYLVHSILLSYPCEVKSASQCNHVSVAFTLKYSYLTTHNDGVTSYEENNKIVMEAANVSCKYLFKVLLLIC